MLSFLFFPFQILSRECFIIVTAEKKWKYQIIKNLWRKMEWISLQSMEMEMNGISNTHQHFDDIANLLSSFLGKVFSIAIRLISSTILILAKLTTRWLCWCECLCFKNKILIKKIFLVGVKNIRSIRLVRWVFYFYQIIAHCCIIKFLVFWREFEDNMLTKLFLHLVNCAKSTAWENF